MTDHTRRRLIQAGVSVPLLGLAGARAQAPADRNLVARERKDASGAAAAPGMPLLVAPRRALVIGNSSYGFGPLKNPANDARAIGEELKRTGFEVTIGLDLSRAQMLETIRAYGESLDKAKAVGLFYFAGHGVQLAWRNYLLPVDAEIRRIEDIAARCVDVNAVIEGIAKAANPMNVVILDACRENPFAGVKLEQKGLSQLDAPPATLLAYATAPGNLASDGEGANGLYTEQLLKEMKVPEAKIEDVFKRVRLTVRRRSNGQQIPWESTSLEEDFWFSPPRDQLRAAQEQAERIQRAQAAAAAERARLEQQAREHRERLERARQEEAERAFEEEARLWERVKDAARPGPLEDYLRRYPSGNFAELAQARLDALLAREGERRIETVSAPQNPYSQGTIRADVAFKVGDSYSYVQLSLETREEQRRLTARVTEITDSEVIFGKGAVILDRLGNNVKLNDGRSFSPRQDHPLEYAVGRKWRTRFVTTTTRGIRSDTVLDFRVGRRERITVPAGTFDCFVVEADGYSFNSNGVRIRVGVRRWVAPDKCRRPIVAEEFRKAEGRVGPPRAGDFRFKDPVFNNTRLELTAFSQS